MYPTASDRADYIPKGQSLPKATFEESGNSPMMIVKWCFVTCNHTVWQFWTDSEAITTLNSIPPANKECVHLVTLPPTNSEVELRLEALAPAKNEVELCLEALPPAKNEVDHQLEALPPTNNEVELRLEALRPVKNKVELLYITVKKAPFFLQ